MPLDNLSELRRRVPGGKYNLARAVAERARQLQSGSATPLVEVKTPNPLSVAIDEIVQGKISFSTLSGDDVDIRDAKLAADAEADAQAAALAEIAAPESLEETLAINSDEADDARAPDAGLEAEVDALIAEAAEIAPSDDSA